MFFIFMVGLMIMMRLMIITRWCRWSYDSRMMIIQRDQVISCSQELLWGDHASLLKSADNCQKPDNMQGILRLFCKDMTNSNFIQMKSRNVFLGPGILTPSGLESRILQPKTKFPYQGVVVVVQNPGFYYSKFVFSLKCVFLDVYIMCTFNPPDLTLL